MRRSIGTYTEAWQAGATQERAKERAGGVCETCGQVTDHMSCHHINMNRGDDSPDNIVYLCNACHLDCHRWSWIPGEMLPLAWARNIPQWIVKRNLPYIEHPQQELWSESK